MVKATSRFTGRSLLAAVSSAALFVSCIETADRPVREILEEDAGTARDAGSLSHDAASDGALPNDASIPDSSIADVGSDTASGTARDAATDSQVDSSSIDAQITDAEGETSSFDAAID